MSYVLYESHPINHPATAMSDIEHATYAEASKEAHDYIERRLGDENYRDGDSHTLYIAEMLDVDNHIIGTLAEVEITIEAEGKNEAGLTEYDFSTRVKLDYIGEEKSLLMMAENKRDCLRFMAEFLQANYAGMSERTRNQFKQLPGQ